MEKVVVFSISKKVIHNLTQQLFIVFFTRIFCLRSYSRYPNKFEEFQGTKKIDQIILRLSLKGQCHHKCVPFRPSDI
jgi:hypothetical protein